ncbi:hypothetical protein [Halobacterium zhouii]|uniref:hypothetical protein n=1 Tax=Halobacterium zhouii TaxID=2902624 RepID=UPI001E2A94ED|nr:hypothetical protein [Halobacterium zhouii]
MNLRLLVSPGLYGGSAAAVVAALGYALAASQSFPLALTAFAFTFGGLVVVSLLTGTASFNENSEAPDGLATQDALISAPTEAGEPRRLLLICFFLGVTLAGIVGLALFR